jgi:hypothetical protein
MPWTARESSRFTRKAKSPKRKRQWSKVANSILKRTGSDERAIRGANSAVKKSSAKRSRKRG